MLNMVSFKIYFYIAFTHCSKRKQISNETYTYSNEYYFTCIILYFWTYQIKNEMLSLDLNENMFKIILFSLKMLRCIPHRSYFESLLLLCFIAPINIRRKVHVWKRGERGLFLLWFLEICLNTTEPSTTVYSTQNSDRSFHDILQKKTFSTNLNRLFFEISKIALNVLSN